MASAVPPFTFRDTSVSIFLLHICRYSEYFSERQLFRKFCSCRKSLLYRMATRNFRKHIQPNANSENQLFVPVTHRQKSDFFSPNGMRKKFSDLADPGLPTETCYITTQVRSGWEVFSWYYCFNNTVLNSMDPLHLNSKDFSER